MHFISSVAMTPADSAVVQRRNKSKYRLSYRSGLGAASRLCLTPALTTRRLSTSRKASKINITVSGKEPYCTMSISEGKFSTLSIFNASYCHRRMWVRSIWRCWWKQNGSCLMWLPSISSDTLNWRTTPGSLLHFLLQRSSRAWR